MTKKGKENYDPALYCVSARPSLEFASEAGKERKKRMDPKDTNPEFKLVVVRINCIAWTDLKFTLFILLKSNSEFLAERGSDIGRVSFGNTVESFESSNAFLTMKEKKKKEQRSKK